MQMNLSLNFQAQQSQAFPMMAMGGGLPHQCSHPQNAPMLQMMMMMQMMMQMVMMMGSQMGGGFMTGMMPFFGQSPMGQGGMMGFPGGAMGPFGNFLGGVPVSQGGGGSQPGQMGGNWAAGGAAPFNPGQAGGATPMGQRLASFAERNANGPGGRCYQWVADALDREGVNLSGMSAYMAADQLARNPKFREVQVPAEQLDKLPAGAVVVWNKGGGRRHGHISIALGDGREASDRVLPQIKNYGTSHRVFLPC